MYHLATMHCVTDRHTALSNSRSVHLKKQQIKT